MNSVLTLYMTCRVISLMSYIVDIKLMTLSNTTRLNVPMHVCIQIYQITEYKLKVLSSMLTFLYIDDFHHI